MLSRDADAANVRIPPPLIYGLSVVIGWLLEEFLMALSVPLLAPVWLGAISAIFGIAGLIMLVYAAGLFLGAGQNPEPWKTTPSIVVKGIYRWTRNPMYVGMAALQIAVGMYLDNAWIMLLTAPSLIAVYVIAVLPEEQYLTQKFGAEYLRYKDSVRRWL